uniref:Uncharacterized protein n=1 Tax=Rhizophora mucronata TaxID=61149 RepID=A0A2P2IQF1_RHIMU
MSLSMFLSNSGFREEDSQRKKLVTHIPRKEGKLQVSNCELSKKSNKNIRDHHQFPQQSTT